jgi:hypothetical protein
MLHKNDSLNTDLIGAVKYFAAAANKIDKQSKMIHILQVIQIRRLSTSTISPAMRS